MGLAERLHSVQDRVARAAARAGRDPASVALIVVTKTHPAEAVAELLAAGHDLLGENKVQELAAKRAALGGRGRWHMIGHLQRNKAAQVVGVAELIHSVDSPALIAELEKRAAARGLTQRVLLEINVAGEASKSGAPPGDLPALLAALEAAPRLRAEGLMCVPPYDPDPERSRPHFARLRELMAAIPPTPAFRPLHLSMGMSGDFEPAIEEGATLVRVGTAIMGERA